VKQAHSVKNNTGIYNLTFSSSSTIHTCTHIGLIQVRLILQGTP